MPLFIIDMLISLIMQFGQVEDQGDAIGYRWGNFTYIDDYGVAVNTLRHRKVEIAVGHQMPDSGFFVVFAVFAERRIV